MSMASRARKSETGALKNLVDLIQTQDESYHMYLKVTSEPRSEKTGLRGFRPGPTQTRLYNHRRWLEA